MSLDKTLTDQYRLPLKLDKYPVAPILPENFATMYPKFIEFIASYYEEYDSLESPAKFLNELQHNRDMADVTPKLLQLIGQEFFLGKDYTDSFLDKESAIQISNLLYRSKGTSFSIEQFFRIFFGFDINIQYGRDEIFTVGDPDQEKLLFVSEYRSGGTDANGDAVSILYPGNRLKFNFSDGAIQVYALALTPKVEIVPSIYIREGETVPEDYINDVGVPDYIIKTAVKTTFNFFYLLKEDKDYEVDYSSDTISFLKPGIKNSVKPGDPWLDYLAEFGEVSPPSRQVDFNGVPFGPLKFPKARIETTRRFPAGSPLGSDIGNKRLTDNGYYQVFSILIKTPISVNAWKEVYKDFIHPSGMYLAGEVLLETTSSVGLLAQPTSIEKYDIEYEGIGTIEDVAYSEVTELNVIPKVTKPVPSPFVFNMQDGDLTLPSIWVGEDNSIMEVTFSRASMLASDQWLLSATSGGLKHGFVFPAATPNKLVYRYVEKTTLNLIDVDVQTDCLLGKTYLVEVLVTSTQIAVSSNGDAVVYNASVEYYPTVSSIGDDFNGAIWDVLLTNPLSTDETISYPLREGSGEIFYAWESNNSEYPSMNINVPPPSRGTWGSSTVPVWNGNNISIPNWTSTSASGFGISLNIGVGTLSNIESLVMWDTNNQTIGLKINTENVLTYLFEHAGGIETIEILSLQVLNNKEYFYVNIEHLSNSVVVTSKQEGSEVTSVITSVNAPTATVDIDYITGSSIVATIWNVELEDGANSRYYPMQDGSGTTMLGYDEDGIATGASGDASLVGNGEWISKNYLTSGGA